MSRFLPLFLDCRKGPSRFLSDYCLLFIEFGADASRPCADVRQGIIAAANRDDRKIVNKGEPANFLVYYPLDDDTSKHNLMATAPTTAGCCSSRSPEGCTRLVVGTGFLGWAWGVSWFLKSVRQMP